MNKKEIRKEYLKIRSQIKRKDKKSQKICSALTAADEYKKAAVIAVYASLADEVDTSFIIDDAQKASKTVLLPKIENKGEMNFYEISSVLTRNALGIKEPDDTKKYFPEEISLIVVPIVCADGQRGRIGFGGGYYDRYLSKFKGDTIGICFDEQISAEPLPCMRHDIKPDIIISDKIIIK